MSVGISEWRIEASGWFDVGICPTSPDTVRPKCVETKIVDTIYVAMGSSAHLTGIRPRFG